MGQMPAPEVAGREVTPITIGLDGMQLTGQVLSDHRPGRGLENPDGVLVVGCNGHATGAEDWQFLTDGVSRASQAVSMDVSTLVFDDGPYFAQAQFTGAVSAAVQQMRRIVPASQAVWLAGISRGGISAVDAAHGLGPEMVQGVTAMATPAGPMHPADAWPVLPWYWMRHHAQMQSADYRAVYASITDRAETRHSADPLAVEAERDEVTRSDITGTLSRLTGKLGIPAALVYYRQDIIVPADTHIGRLRAAGLGGLACRMDGTHFTPFVDAATHLALVRQISRHTLRLAA